MTPRLSLVLLATLLVLAGCDKSARTAPGSPAPESSVPATGNIASPAAPVIPETSGVGSAPVPGAGETGGKLVPVKQACAEDLAKFCPGVDKPFKCLSEHRTELSEVCRANRAAHKAAREAAGLH